MDMDKPYYALTVDQVLQRFSSGLRGLSSSEAKRRLETFGPNVIGTAAQEPLWEEILEILAEPMVLLLIGAMIIFFL
jgi:Ca2+-transporting ATPase